MIGRLGTVSPAKADESASRDGLSNVMLSACPRTVNVSAASGRGSSTGMRIPTCRVPTTRWSRSSAATIGINGASLAERRPLLRWSSAVRFVSSLRPPPKRDISHRKIFPPAISMPGHNCELNWTLVAKNKNSAPDFAVTRRPSLPNSNNNSSS